MEDKLLRRGIAYSQQGAFASADATKAFRSPWTFGLHAFNILSASVTFKLKLSELLLHTTCQLPTRSKEPNRLDHIRCSSGEGPGEGLLAQKPPPPEFLLEG